MPLGVSHRQGLAQSRLEAVSRLAITDDCLRSHPLGPSMGKAN